MAKKTFEEIKPWDGTSGTGSEARLVVKENFDKVNEAIDELPGEFVSVSDQELTSEQKEKARENIGAFGSGDVTGELGDSERKVVNQKILTKSISIYNVSEFHPKETGFYDLTSAISAIPVGVKRRGLIIQYESAAGVFNIWKFKGETIDLFNNVSYWELFLSNSNSIDSKNQVLTNSFSWENGIINSLGFFENITYHKFSNAISVKENDTISYKGKTSHPAIIAFANGTVHSVLLGVILDNSQENKVTVPQGVEFVLFNIDQRVTFNISVVNYGEDINPFKNRIQCDEYIVDVDIDIIKDEFIDYKTGVIGGGVLYHRTDYVACNAGDIFYVTSDDSATKVYLYNNSKNPICLLASGVLNSREIRIPDSGKYFCVSNSKKNISINKFTFPSVKIKTKEYNALKAFLDVYALKQFGFDDFIGLLTTTGAGNPNTSWRNTGLKAVKPGELIFYTGAGSGESSRALIAFFDENQTFIKAPLNATSTTGFFKYEIEIPEGVFFIAAYTYLPNTTEFKLERYMIENDLDPDNWQYPLNKSWCCLGHSVWAFDVPGNPSKVGTQTLVRQKVKFSQYLSVAQSGHKLIDQMGLIPVTPYDVYSIDTAFNDWHLNVPLGSTSDFDNNTGNSTFYGQLRSLHTALNSKNQYYQLLFGTSLQSWSYGDTNTNGNTLEDFNAAIKYASGKMGWTVIDQYNKSNITFFNAAKYTLYSDTVHPNPVGYQRYAGLWVNAFMSIV